MVIELPDELHDQFRSACSSAGTTQTSLVRNWVKAYVGGDAPTQAKLPVRPIRSLSKKAQASGKSRK